MFYRCSIVIPSPLRRCINAVCLTLCGIVLPLPAYAFPFPFYATVYEYLNEKTGHYVLLSDSNEIAGVDAGAAGAGWRRTGYIFEAYHDSSRADVCRFYASGPNSHFFTADAAECNTLRNSNSGWIFEKIDFTVGVPRNGSCEPGQSPIYRLYNNRWMFNDSNHRFTSDAVIRDQMLVKGWVDEGIAFCANYSALVPASSFLVETEKVQAKTVCENESVNLGPCVALYQLPEMPNVIQPFLPPWYVDQNPVYDFGTDQITGFLDLMRWSGNLHSSQLTANFETHSFVKTGYDTFGIYVNSYERGTFAYTSINPLYQFTTTPPLPGAQDLRVFPWHDERPHDVVVSFKLEVRTIRRANPESHAYGHPTLQFIDAKSHRHFYFTLQTYGTVAPGDSLTLDASTGRPIVSTVFRSNPAFGTRLSGDFIPCTATAVSGSCAVQLQPTSSSALTAQISRA
ncbi:conserved hypothetical protein [Candidatus Nitrotoga sp. HW29]|uniref:hypothetical protein n=1 Tax=Candidatus Nitrotoga sp. HW29 TaxID=2886963 RepID=UPI001EF233A6|nr:hypothetical protein [Candidatus Nitrotoga sp. HW29]CAH1905802.1 conserved hypothetical protein [Candidatus Nitrotoga sp. HW29]